MYVYIYIYIYIYIYVYIYIYKQQQKDELRPSFGMVLAHFYVAVYMFDMTPCELFLLVKNGSSNLKRLAVGADNI